MIDFIPSLSSDEVQVLKSAKIQCGPCSYYVSAKEPHAQDLMDQIWEKGWHWSLRKLPFDKEHPIACLYEAELTYFAPSQTRLDWEDECIAFARSTKAMVALGAAMAEAISAQTESS